MTSRSSPGGLSGLVLLRKPGGITSFEALNPIKKNQGCKKAGHAGTLDKFAEGLLITLLGSFTKLTPYFVQMDKVYEATIRFGQETDTLDPEGEIVAEGPVPNVSAIEAVLAEFRGPIDQVPPKYSALHVAGRRAHSLARQGEQFEMKPRRVTVYDLSIVAFDSPDLMITVRCSKGTYIRSLARDIAAAAGSRGFVSALIRHSIGPYSLEDAVFPEQFDPELHIIQERDVFSSLDFIQCLTLTPGSVPAVEKGVHISDTFFQKKPSDDGLYALFSPENRFVALMEQSEGNYSYKFVRPAVC